MPLDIPMPWLRGPDTLGALASGASAGAAAGRLQQESVNESGRLAMDANRLRQSAQLEQARLQQADEHAQMEFQARQKLTEQNQLREQQRLQIENAYKTASLGIAKGRLEQTQAAAEEKAKAAALTFQREQNFARAVASGVPPVEAYRQFPVSPSLLNAVSRTQLKEDKGTAPIIREGRFPIVKVNPVTGENEVLYTPPTDTTKLTQVQVENLRDARHERDLLEKATPKSQEEDETNKERIRAINYNIERIKRGKPLAPTKSKVDRAHEVSAQHPDWTKEQVIKAVNDELQ